MQQLRAQQQQLGILQQQLLLMERQKQLQHQQQYQQPRSPQPSQPNCKRARVSRRDDDAADSDDDASDIDDIDDDHMDDMPPLIHPREAAPWSLQMKRALVDVHNGLEAGAGRNGAAVVAVVKATPSGWVYNSTSPHQSQDEARSDPMGRLPGAVDGAAAPAADRGTASGAATEQWPGQPRSRQQVNATPAVCGKAWNGEGGAKLKAAAKTSDIDP